MKSSQLPLVFFLVGSTMQPALALDVLRANEALFKGQYISSATGNYTLIMQDDGSLVMYRRDGSKRYGMAKRGEFALMQPDGNFVEYASAWRPLWNSSTYGNPGAFLAIQDDGNLVVYSSNGVPLWNIGAEIGGDPRKMADTVGRDLNSPGAGVFGHVGIFDGSSVYSASPGGNGIRIDSFATFKNTTNYWGAASPNIAGGYVYGCFETSCGLSGANFETVVPRMAAIRAARQQYLLGVDYTIGASFSFGQPAIYPATYPTTRGLFRCDTFVYGMMLATRTDPTGLQSADQKLWNQRINSISQEVITPHYLFNKLNSFR